LDIIFNLIFRYCPSCCGYREEIINIAGGDDCRKKKQDLYLIGIKILCTIVSQCPRRGSLRDDIITIIKDRFQQNNDHDCCEVYHEEHHTTLNKVMKMILMEDDCDNHDAVMIMVDSNTSTSDSDDVSVREEQYML
jgi:hypothetical protein